MRQRMADAAQLTVKRDEQKGKIWSYLRSKWKNETPEERVRQEYLCVLVNEYGFSHDQMDEELEVTGRGSGHARADFVIWRSAQDKTDQKSPLIIVECKSDNVTIKAPDYGQGDNYARLTNARFFVTHNSRETRYWRVVHEHMPKTLEEIENIPHADDTDKEIEALLSKLKTFKEDEFADLLHQCHNIIRNRQKLDPAAAFDEIAKILFVKVYVERELRSKRRRKNIFTVEFLDEQIGDDPLNDLFEKTKRFYKEDQIFEKDDRVNLKPATGREIAQKEGIPVYIHQHLLENMGMRSGKGEALWKSLFVTRGDIIVWIDTDIVNIHPRFVYGIIGPLLQNPQIELVKGFYRRPLKVGSKMQAGGGGRVTELMARPLLNLFYPELSGVVQPLSGEYGGRRTALEQATFSSGYGVETGLLIDIYERYGIRGIAQVDLQEGVHHNQPLEALSKMSFAIIQAVIRKLERRYGRAILEEVNKTMKLIRYGDERFFLDVEEIAEQERPPIVSLPEYRAVRKEGEK